MLVEKLVGKGLLTNDVTKEGGDCFYYYDPRAPGVILNVWQRKRGGSKTGKLTQKSFIASISARLLDPHPCARPGLPKINDLRKFLKIKNKSEFKTKMINF